MKMQEQLIDLEDEMGSAVIMECSNMVIKELDKLAIGKLCMASRDQGSCLNVGLK